VKYLSGSNLGVTRKQIKVEVSFVSEKPISFTVKLNFFDNNGRSFLINISGTADTHTFTLLDSEKNNANWAANL
jgi:carbon monoxide dehydrogenase subunit G